MSSEPFSSRQQNIKERTTRLQEEAAALQAQIMRHLEHRHGQASPAAQFDEEDDELTA